MYKAISRLAAVAILSASVMMLGCGAQGPDDPDRDPDDRKDEHEEDRSSARADGETRDPRHRGIVGGVLHRQGGSRLDPSAGAV